MTMHALTGCQVVSNCVSACSSMMWPGHGLFSLLTLLTDTLSALQQWTQRMTPPG